MNEVSTLSSRSSWIQLLFGWGDRFLHNEKLNAGHTVEFPGTNSELSGSFDANGEYINVYD